LARRGYRITALELGSNLAEYARQQLAAFPQVQVVHTAFEDWSPPDGEFDLVISASAFHWIRPELRYSRTAASLKAGGALGLFWNHSPPSDEPFYRAAQGIWRELAPDIFGVPRRSTQDAVASTVAEIGDSGLYGPVTVCHFDWSQEYSADEYVQLLSTYSSVHCLPDEIRREGLSRISALVYKMGGKVERVYSAVLYVAQKRENRPS
jgi:hypothetical protein